jgi:shikimate dehydrogenase/3-dehydroquinate dehydratase type I
MAFGQGEPSGDNRNPRPEWARGFLIFMDRAVPIPAQVASLAPRDVEDARRLLAIVPPEASAVEWRLDLAEHPVPASVLMALDARPAIVTWRSMREGGAFQGGAEAYRRLLTEAYAAGATIDVEQESGLLDGRVAFPERHRVIASLHAPFARPDDWRDRKAAMLATGARAVKLVFGAADLASGLAVAALQKETPEERVAILPMGPGSPPGRVLSALFGAALAYGPVERDTAAGQIPIAELLRVYEIGRKRRIDALFGIIGENPSRSLSPLVHNALFRSADLPFLYLPLPVSDFVREAPHRIGFDPPFRGFSVTQPWKEEAARVGARGGDVRATGAANTLVRQRGGWRAENSDVDGVFDTLADHDTGEGRTAVILGAGGAARAAAVAARKLGYEVDIAARRDAEAERVATELGCGWIPWGGVPASEADLYVNATPVGWKDDDPSAIPASLFEARPLVFDCVYRRDGRETATIRAARAAKCPTVDGLQMFAAQAVRQSRLFGVEGVTLEDVTCLLGAEVGR